MSVAGFIEDWYGLEPYSVLGKHKVQDCFKLSK